MTLATSPRAGGRERPISLVTPPSAAVCSARKEGGESSSLDPICKGVVASLLRACAHTFVHTHPPPSLAPLCTQATEDDQPVFYGPGVPGSPGTPSPPHTGGPECNCFDCCYDRAYGVWPVVDGVWW